MPIDPIRKYWNEDSAGSSIIMEFYQTYFNNKFRIAILHSSIESKIVAEPLSGRSGFHL